MLSTLIELVLAPMLAAVATVAGRRWGPRSGGVVSAFPAIVGPVLLVTVLQHGTAFAARAANGTLLGLVALSGFALTYGRVARRRRWPASLAVGWIAAAVAALAVARAAGGAGAPAGLLVAIGSLGLAHRGLSDRPEDPPGRPDPLTPAPPPRDVPLRMALTAVLVFSLATAATILGPLVGGMLAALPVLASMLAVFTHRQEGGAAAAALLRGTLAGMAGFVAFVELVAVLVVPDGPVTAFAGATLLAVIVQTFAVRAPLRACRRLALPT